MSRVVNEKRKGPAAHRRDVEKFNSKHEVGVRVRYWSNLREGDPSGEAVTVEAAGLWCGSYGAVRIRRDSGGTDVIALTHVEAVPAKMDDWVGRLVEVVVAIETKAKLKYPRGSRLVVDSHHRGKLDLCEPGDGAVRARSIPTSWLKIIGPVFADHTPAQATPTVAIGDEVDFYADGDLNPHRLRVLAVHPDASCDLGLGDEVRAERVRYDQNGTNDNLHHRWALLS